MSIVNNAHPGSQINLLCLIYRFIQRNAGKYTEEEIVEMCRPENLLWKPDHRKRFTENLRFWMNETRKLWRFDENKKLHLEKIDELKSPTSRDISTKVLAALFPKDFGSLDKVDKDIVPLVHTLACIFASNKFVPLSGEELTRERLFDLQSEFMPNSVLNNSSQATFLEYGHFLGFFESVGAGYIVDPSVVLLNVLPRIFDGKNSLTARDFIARLGKLIPIFDGGSYRLEVENSMVSNGWSPSKPGVLSLSLSHAIERLRLDSTIQLETFSDDSHALMLEFFDGQRQFSLIRLTGERA